MCRATVGPDVRRARADSLTTAASGYTLAVSSSGFSAATSSTITVTPAAATQLVITQQQPSSVAVNSAFGLIVAVEDPYGNVVTSAATRSRWRWTITPPKPSSAARLP